MNRFDELLNKFLDNDINNAEIDEFNKLLNVSENQVKYKSVQILESAFGNMTVDSAPKNITDEILKRINSSAGSKIKTDRFMIIISTIFIVSIITTIIYFLFGASAKISTANFTSHLNEFISFININKDMISGIFRNQFVFIIGVLSSFLLILNFILSLDAYKSLKEKITKA